MSEMKELDDTIFKHYIVLMTIRVLMRKSSVQESTGDVVVNYYLIITIHYKLSITTIEVQQFNNTTMQQFKLLITTIKGKQVIPLYV